MFWSKAESFRRMKYSGMLSAAFDGQILVLARQAHIQPTAALRNDLARLIVAHPLQQGLVQQLWKSFLPSRIENAVGQHGDCGIALGFGDQRLFAECIADAELGELDAVLLSGVSRVTMHLPLTMM